MAPQRGNLDQQVTMEHLSANTTSQQTFHNIVADRGKSTFNGRIHIHAGARNSNANLSNKNIGLGANATINTKPELEIYNDDVSCSHGATIGQLDNDQLFYLCSRGVTPMLPGSCCVRASYNNVLVVHWQTAPPPACSSLYKV